MTVPADTSGHVLEIAGLSKDYHGLRPLRIEKLTVAAGEQVALLGLDQPMAETFVNLATGATLADQGDVRVFGRSTALVEDSREWLALVNRFGIVSPRAVLLAGLSAIQNVSMPFTLDIEPPDDEVRERAETLLRDVGLAESLWNGPLAGLTHAGHVRVQLARALALDPAVLLLEHAGAGLPHEEVTSFATVIGDLAARRQMAVIAMTANALFASAVARRVLTLEPATGRLVEQRRGFLRRFLS